MLRDRYGRELPEPEPRVPGRSTPTARLPASADAIARQVAAQLGGGRPATPVQAKGKLDLDSAAVHAVASRGTEGTGGALPFLDQIQRAFGRHDVSDVRAYVGGRAADSARALGARAYASGDAVAFAGTPDLHTAAHEAAHVVQQRGGVQLAGGVGREGDVYERHADEVADAVTRGESVEVLLDRFANSGSGGAGVQRAVQLDRGAAQSGAADCGTEADQSAGALDAGQQQMEQRLAAIRAEGQQLFDQRQAAAQAVAGATDTILGEVEQWERSHSLSSRLETDFFSAVGGALVENVADQILGEVFAGPVAKWVYFTVKTAIQMGMAAGEVADNRAAIAANTQVENLALSTSRAAVRSVILGQSSAAAHLGSLWGRLDELTAGRQREIQQSTRRTNEELDAACGGGPRAPETAQRHAGEIENSQVSAIDDAEQIIRSMRAAVSRLWQAPATIRAEGRRGLVIAQGLFGQGRDGITALTGSLSLSYPVLQIESQIGEEPNRTRMHESATVATLAAELPVEIRLQVLGRDVFFFDQRSPTRLGSVTIQCLGNGEVVWSGMTDEQLGHGLTGGYSADGTQLDQNQIVTRGRQFRERVNGALRSHPLSELRMLDLSDEQQPSANNAGPRSSDGGGHAPRTGPSPAGQASE